jgi:hypothetical protein
MSTSPFWAIHKSLELFANIFQMNSKKRKNNISERKTKANTFQFLASYNSVDVTKVLN